MPDHHDFQPQRHESLLLPQSMPGERVAFLVKTVHDAYHHHHKVERFSPTLMIYARNLNISLQTDFK